MENVSTWKPSSFAARKCPNSWMNIASEKSNMQAMIAKTVIRISIL